MSTPFWKHMARLPRHDATKDVDVEVRIQFSEAPEDFVNAELADVSRNGLQLLTDRQLPEGVEVVVRIIQPSSDLNLGFPGTIRWQRVEGDGVWAVGCQFEEQLEWEDYGELFLNGILESE